MISNLALSLGAHFPDANLAKARLILQISLEQQCQSVKALVKNIRAFGGYLLLMGSSDSRISRSHLHLKCS